MPSNSDRADITNGIYTVLSTYSASNPSRLARSYLARPMNVTADLPCAFIDSVTEAVGHDSGTRTRTLQAVVVVVRANSDNPEVAAALDVTVDGLTEAFTANPQFIADTMSSEWTVEDTEEQFGDLLLPGVRFTFPKITIMVGRN